MKRLSQLLIAVLLTAHFMSSSAPAYAAENPDDEERNPELVEEVEEPVHRDQSSYEPLPQGKHQPWRLVRALQRLQDEIVAGKPRSLEAYRILLLRTFRWMDELEPAVWNHERNLDAVAVYLLIGGRTEIGYKALRYTELEDWQKLTLEAALAYAERDAGTAYDKMLAFDHRVLPPSISAQFALAKSMVSSSTDLKLTEKYLQEARRLAPGTLIEEASLRRAVRISGETRSFDDFANLSKTYLHRFSRSHYFGDFLKNFSFSLVRMPEDNELESLDILKALMEMASPHQQLTVTAYVARQAVVSGRRVLADWSSRAALEIASPGSKFYTRMQLYSAATNIVNLDDAIRSLEALENMDPEIFDRSDQKIHIAALSLGKQIIKRNEPEKSSLASRGDQMLDTSSSIPDNQDERARVPDNKTISRAEALLAELEQIQLEVFK